MTPSAKSSRPSRSRRSTRPVAGTVVEINQDLVDNPQALNEDPYGAGWICVIEVPGHEGYQGLLTSEAYRELIAEEQ